MKNRSVMTGVVTEEWTRHIGMFIEDMYNSRPELDSQFNDGMDGETFRTAVQYVMCCRFGYDESVAKIVLHEYTNWTTGDDPLVHRRQYIHMITDMAMVSPTVELARYYADAASPVYVYAVNHHKQLMSKEYYEEWQSNYHEMELSYIFGCPFTGISTDSGGPEIYTDIDKKLSRHFMHLWTNFAKYGNPSITVEPDVVDNEMTPLLWTRFNSSTSDFLLIDTNSSTMRRHLRADKVNFWTRLLPAVSTHIRQLQHSGRPEITYGPSVDAVQETYFCRNSNYCDDWVWSRRWSYEHSTWVLSSVVVLQAALLAVAVLLILRMRRRYGKLSRSSRERPPVAKM
jgi:hypothetical protein